MPAIARIGSGPDQNGLTPSCNDVNVTYIYVGVGPGKGSPLNQETAGVTGMLGDMVAKVDSIGRPAWIGLMVLGFIFFWPVGLATLAFLLWSDRMGCGRWGHGNERFERKMEAFRDRFGRGSGSGRSGFAATGNRAFDEYREETLRRLEDEAREFGDFLSRLRMAKDKAEFDQFMSERRSNPPAPREPGPAAA